MTNKFLKNQLNVNWLRPETALWRSIDSTLISKYEIKAPSLDLGCGNGIHSFITAGGNFSLDYDSYMNTELNGFFEGNDIYDVCTRNDISSYITTESDYKFTYGLDHKNNLLDQARQLELYDNLILHDANKKLPFGKNEFETVFCNILYWLDSPEKSLQEIRRILKPGGVVLLHIPNIKFKDYCFTYHWKQDDSGLLKKLNRGRSESMQWEISHEDFSNMAEHLGFRIVEHTPYLSKLTLQIWDIGLRPISPYLIEMANKMSFDDRCHIKSGWIDTFYDLLKPLYTMDMNDKDGGFHFYVLEKV